MFHVVIFVTALIIGVGFGCIGTILFQHDQEVKEKKTNESHYSDGYYQGAKDYMEAYIDWYQRQYTEMSYIDVEMLHNLYSAFKKGEVIV